MGWLSLDGDHHWQSLNISPLIWIASKISQNTCKQKWITGHQLGNDIPPNTEDIYTKNNRKLKDPQMGSLIWEYPYTIIYMYTIITCVYIYKHIYTYIYINLYIYIYINGGFRKDPKSFPCHHVQKSLKPPGCWRQCWQLASSRFNLRPNDPVIGWDLITLISVVDDMFKPSLLQISINI